LIARRRKGLARRAGIDIAEPYRWLVIIPAWTPPTKKNEKPAPKPIEKMSAAGLTLGLN
jgi:hypothetical protein